MKKILLVILICGLYLPLWSQLAVDAGSNKHLCQDEDTVYLGGNPTAWGGTPPYTYCWWVEYRPWFPGSHIYYRASYLLDDTTSANPRVLFESSSLNSLSCIYLTVTDNSGQSVTDSVSVTASQFVHLLSLPWHYSVIPGDSLWITGVGNIASLFPSSCLWRPSAGLSDTTLCDGFWAKPDTTTTYYQVLIDTFGCMAGPHEAFTVHMSGVNVPEADLPEYVHVYPNPAREQALFVWDFGTGQAPHAQLLIFDPAGKAILARQLEDATGQWSWETGNIPAGSYLYRIICHGRPAASGKIVVAK
ncbi:MAG: T9SS type A sorting domain-containing protein [Bacteroidales bacterium]|jgi:hypothetical protein|nr:T9SS type A sorting domain-containing protein [Bacteroidales bacterium]